MSAASQPTGSLAVAVAHAERLLDKSPALAASQAAEILAVAPNHPQATLILGVAKRRSGEIDAAHALLTTLAATHPRSAMTQFELGLTLAALGADTEALAAVRRAVALKPDLTSAWRTLGDMLTLTGDTDAADAAYAQHIRAAIRDPALLTAAAALCDGRLDVAEHLLRDHLKQNPTDVAAIRMLAEAGTRLGRYADAEKLLFRCLELAPSFIGARHNYAIVLFRQHKAAEAIPHIEQLLAHDPTDISYRNLLAACLAVIGDYHRAIEIFDSVLRQHPNQPKIWMSYGHALKTAGRQSDSVAAYRKSIALNPSLGEAYWSLGNLKTVPFTEDDRVAMRAQLMRDGLSVEDRFHLHYALGRALEQAKDFAGSFTHYAEGARLRRSQISYDADKTTAQMLSARAFFSPSLFAERQGQGCKSAAPIFIVGLPRSGSTLIEQILSSHSAVEGTMELPEIAALSREVSAAAAYPEILGDLDGSSLAELGERFIKRSRLYRKLDKPIFIDKMPNNFAHIGFIHLILPNAKIIDARRHPMATCFSAFKQHFARGQNFSYDLEELGRYYRDYVALMEHFDTIQPGLVHRVQYENLVADTETEIRRLLEYCNLPFEPACLSFHQNRRAVRTASSEQVRQPIFTDAVDHWRHYEPWLGPLKRALGDVVD
jgi:tetratricopeptide (TPR) repeat protein